MWPSQTLEIINARQARIRDLEWLAVEPYLSEIGPGRFLDVGCGTGFAMRKAQKLGFEVSGIEPSVGEFGVRNDQEKDIRGLIQCGVAEDMPYEDHSFDIVYSSHALEHFDDRVKGLAEVNRVLKPGGRVIILVPTAAMASVRILTLFLFTTHRRIGKFLIKSRNLKTFKEILLPPAHGTVSDSAFGDIDDFRVANWEKLIQGTFEIDRILKPVFYPYPNYPQFFPMYGSGRVSSSVAFICKSREL
jgi:ubiquinone/menaquinone biosynthesis C-methylase UbiE